MTELEGETRPGGAERPRGRRAPLVLGVLGGVASGKSLAARLLAGEEGLWLSADRIAHEVLASDEVTALVRERFGEAFLGPDGRPDRARLAERAFDGPDGESDRRALEGWIHPRVRARILDRVREARAEGVERIVVDVPLLLENDAQHGFVALCDALVFVEASREVREERARRDRGWQPGDVARREAAQLPLEEKRQRARFVLPNNGTPEDLEREVGRIRDELDRLP